MPTPPDPSGPPDPADVLLSKAQQDHHLAELVANDASVSSEHIGFFCQQAVEKSIKSVLSRRSIRYRRTHDLAELLDLLKDNQVEYPAELEQSVALTPFAAEMRYTTSRRNRPTIRRSTEAARCDWQRWRLNGR